MASRNILQNSSQLYRLSGRQSSPTALFLAMIFIALSTSSYENFANYSIFGLSNLLPSSITSYFLTNLTIASSNYYPINV